MFTEELNYINDTRIRESAKILLEGLPEYFYTIPASSTGKYHPDFASGEGGLVRHTKVAVRMAYELYQITPYDKLFTQHEKDIMIVALLIHDGLKKGNPEEKYTCFDHPILAAKYAEDMQSKTSLTDVTKIYIVKKGDSLYSIARAYNTTVADLKKINNLSSNLLSIGQKIKISN